ncbi:MAG: hypothetical protein EOO63_12650 [Hymenobacter sp.]|nr:MAG: hypothetical protein EOO63_12650 [Hymenobacter sp.]
MVTDCEVRRGEGPRTPHDRPHPHFHIVANRVADNGKTVSDGLNYARSEKLLRELEKKYDLAPVVSQDKRLSVENVPAHDQARIHLREAVQECARTARNLTELTRAVQAQGIRAQLHQNAAGEATGISFEQAGQRFKGSQLARSLSLGGLNKLLAQNQAKVNVQPEMSQAPTIGVRIRR